MISAWRGIDANDAEQQVKNLRGRIVSVESEIEAFRVFGDLSRIGFGHQLALNSLKRRRESLQESLWEVLALREREVIKVSLAGPEFDRHSASFGSLANFLQSTQRLFTSVVQAITTGPTERGPVPFPVLHASELRLAEVFPSSFGMVVELGRQENPLVRTTLERSLQGMFGLLASTPESDQLLDRAGHLGVRTMNHYRRLITGLRKSETLPMIVWSDPAGNANSWEPSSDSLGAIAHALEGIRAERSESLNATGVLVGASLLKSTFELLTDEGDVIEGSVAAEAFEKILAAFASRCRIRYTKSETVNRISGTSRTVVTLTDIETIDGSEPPTGLAPIGIG